MTRIKDSCQTNTGLQRSHASEVDFVIHNMSSSLVIDRVDDLVVAIVFVTVQILGLTTVTYLLLVNCPVYIRQVKDTYPSSGGKANRWVARC